MAWNSPQGRDRVTLQPLEMVTSRPIIRQRLKYGLVPLSDTLLAKADMGHGLLSKMKMHFRPWLSKSSVL